MKPIVDTFHECRKQLPNWPSGPSLNRPISWSNVLRQNASDAAPDSVLDEKRSRVVFHFEPSSRAASRVMQMPPSSNADNGRSAGKSRVRAPPSLRIRMRSEDLCRLDDLQ